MRFNLLIAGLFFTWFIAEGQSIAIIPQPASVRQPKIAAKFNINPSTQIVLEGSGLEATARFLNDYLQQCYLFKLKIATRAAGPNSIVLNYERMDNALPGAYRMTVNAKGVYIAGDNASGVFYGMQTLIQLLPVPEARLKMRPNSLAIPYVSIEDAPRFGYRGMMLDVCRHFFPVSFIKRYIDYLALHKFNKFHWHLTDDQGWRIEIKKYPKLTGVGAWRNGTIIGRYPGKGNDGERYGGYYTQEQIKEVIKYAADRYIDILPEIEMPGHASAAIAAYPELSCFPDEPTTKYYPKRCAWAGDSTGKQVVQSWGVYDDVFVPSDNTFKFLENVIDEVVALFPYEYIHIGGDECPKNNWKRSALCQQLIKEKNLKDEHELQSFFIQRMEKYINSKGKKIIGWDEILEGGLAPNAAVMSWRGEAGGIAAAKQQHEVVMTPTTYVYFDYSQTTNDDSVTIGGFLPLDKVYNYEPLPKELGEEYYKYISGAQANLWTEYIAFPSKVEYMIFPRMTALSEVLWSKKEKKNLSDFENRLRTQFKRYDLWRASYSKAYFDLRASVLPTDDYNGVLLKFESKTQNARITWTPSMTSPTLNTYDKPILINKNVDQLTARLEVNGKLVNTVSQSIHYNKATGKKITIKPDPSKNYPGDGAFTLVNGIVNDKGLARSREFLGWSGDDLEAIIDLGSAQSINSAIVHTLSSGGSWVYPPAGAELFTSDDGQNFKAAAKTEAFELTNGFNGVMKLSFSPVTTRYVKIVVKNYGIIPADKQGAGNKSWLFVDEIEID